MREDVFDLVEFSARCHRGAVAKGWWEGDTTHPSVIPEKLALIHSEVSEALEAYREPHSLALWEDTDHEDKPEGIAAELADVIIRVLDLCEQHQWPLFKALRAKQAYNERRPYRHGGKRC